MTSWLVGHAVDNVWCRPSEDGRFIIKPQRLCDKRGDVHGVQVSEHHIQLPDTTSWFHTFQIGLQDPAALGFEVWGGWRSAKELVNRNGVVIFAYNEDGRHVPLDLVYFRYISNRNLLVAVKRYETQINFGKVDLYLKIYKGKFQTSDAWTDAHTVYCESTVVRKPEDITSMLVRYAQAKAKPGYVFCHVNGYPVETLNAQNVKPWDYVEFLHDGTVLEIHDFYLDELIDFYSTLDGVKKFLVHLPKKVDQVLHLNDLELFIYKGDVGRFVHTHMMADLRQLTHRDFSLGAQHIYDYGVRNPDWWNLSYDARIRVFVRNPALGNVVQYDANRILELYEMNDGQIISALVGPDNSIENWRAEVLEQAAYSRLINALPGNITRKLVTDAYGYNASSKLLGDNYLPVQYDTNGNPIVGLGHLMLQQCTVFEYDSNGLLLGWYDHNVFSGSVYECEHLETAFVEPIEGVGTNRLDIEFGMTMSKVDPQYQYRYYLDETISEQPSGRYTEVTGSNAYDVLADSSVVWHVDPTRFLPARQSDRTFLINEFTFTYEDVMTKNGLLMVNAEYDSLKMGERTPLMFEPETVEVWLNGRSLVVGLQAVVSWPFIGICDRALLDILGKTDFNIVLRVRNFLPLGERYAMPDYGFVYDGLLSNNSKYDVKDDKVIRIIAGGRMYGRSDVDFREDVPTLGKHPVTNGTPYQITDPLVPLRKQVEYPTYAMRKIAKALDVAVEDYLTQKLPTPPASEYNPIPTRYNLYSLTLNKLVLDMVNGQFAIEERPGNAITSAELEERMRPYEKFLAVDAAYLTTDPHYVSFYPLASPGTATLYPLEFSFIERVNKTYFNNRVILNTQLKVEDRPT